MGDSRARSTKKKMTVEHHVVPQRKEMFKGWDVLERHRSLLEAVTRE